MKTIAKTKGWLLIDNCGNAIVLDPREDYESIKDMLNKSLKERNAQHCTTKKALYLVIDRYIRGDLDKR